MPSLPAQRWQWAGRDGGPSWPVIGCAWRWAFLQGCEEPACCAVFVSEAPCLHDRLSIQLLRLWTHCFLNFLRVPSSKFLFFSVPHIVSLRSTFFLFFLLSSRPLPFLSFKPAPFLKCLVIRAALATEARLL